MKNTTTYLLPIWIDLEHDNPEAIMMTLNDALTDFFEEQSRQIAEVGCAIEIQWSINQHLNLVGRTRSEAAGSQRETRDQED